MISLVYVCILLLIAVAKAASSDLPHRQHRDHVRTVYEWSLGTWVENLAIMSNGSILVTLLNTPQLWHVNPFTKQASLVAEIGGYDGLLGITETRHGLFAFIAGNFSLDPLGSVPGTYAVWQVDTSSSPFAISKIADVPQAAFLNGMDYLGEQQHAVLMADSEQGLVYRFDLDSRKTSVAIDSPYLKKCRPTYLEGINGLKVQGGYVWYTNAYCGFFARIPIDAAGHATGPSELLTYTAQPGEAGYDDLVVTQEGIAYIAGGINNVIVEAAPPRLLPGGSGVGQNLGNGTALWAKEDIAGNLNSTAIAEPTACRFGRTRWDRDILYVATGGGSGGPIGGDIVIGGQIVAVDLKRRRGRVRPFA